MAKGSVRKKGKKWYYRFYVENESGNLVQREFVGTESKSETEAMLRKAMEDYEEKKFVAKSENITVGDLLDMWVEEELKPGNLSNGTVMSLCGYGDTNQKAPDSTAKTENSDSRPFAGVYGFAQLRRQESRRHNGKGSEQGLHTVVLGSSARSVSVCGLSEKADNIQSNAVRCLAAKEECHRAVLGRGRSGNADSYSQAVFEADGVSENKTKPRSAPDTDSLLHGLANRRGLRLDVERH